MLNLAAIMAGQRRRAEAAILAARAEAALASMLPAYQPHLAARDMLAHPERPSWHAKRQGGNSARRSGSSAAAPSLGVARR